MSTRTVLILTHSADEYVVERVSTALVRRGVRALRFDTDLFPRRALLSARIGAEAPAHRLDTGLANGAAHVELGDVQAVWARKIWMPDLAEDLDPGLRDGCVRESAAALIAILDGLSGARWINPHTAGIAAENKLLQLRVAREVGLRVPETLVTNDPAAARAFHSERAPLVAKMLTPLSIGMARAPLFVHTSAVRDEDLAHLEGLRHSPMVFQERIEKDVELRVACVGERVYTGTIDASRSEHGRVDWRLSRPDEVSWKRGTLPSDVERRVVELVRRLGLVYGAVDLIRTPEGEHVFLEINPGGEWGMLERDLGLSISEALADELVAGEEVRR